MPTCSNSGRPLVAGATTRALIEANRPSRMHSSAEDRLSPSPSPTTPEPFHQASHVAPLLLPYCPTQPAARTPCRRVAPACTALAAALLRPAPKYLLALPPLRAARTALATPPVPRHLHCLARPAAYGALRPHPTPPAALPTALAAPTHLTPVLPALPAACAVLHSPPPGLPQPAHRPYCHAALTTPPYPPPVLPRLTVLPCCPAPPAARTAPPHPDSVLPRPTLPARPAVPPRPARRPSCSPPCSVPPCPVPPRASACSHSRGRAGALARHKPSISRYLKAGHPPRGFRPGKNSGVSASGYRAHAHS